MLVLVNTGVRAEWTYVAISNSGSNNDYSMYIDITTVRKNNNLVKVWKLEDFKEAQDIGNKKFLSARSQEEVDCKEEQIRIRSIIWSKDNMAHGEVLGNYNKISEWGPIPPNSMSDELLKFVCGKQ